MAVPNVKNTGQNDHGKTRVVNPTASSGQEKFRRLWKYIEENPNSWAALALAAAVLFLFGKALFSRDILISNIYGDLANQFYAWREFGFSELKKGHLALWNPYTFSGAPYFAGFQSALLYPPNWLFMVLPLVLALNFSIVLHIFLSSYFTWLWLRKHNLGFVPGLFGAFAYMFGGAFYLHVYAGHLSNLCTIAWIPLAFLALENLLESPSPKRLLGGAIVFSMMLLAGHVQYFVYSLFFSGAYALALVLMDRRFWVKKTCWALAMILAAMALTAVQWLPGLAAAGESLREAPASPELQRLYSLPPLSLLTLFSSGLNGNLYRFSCWAGPRFWWESSLFMGSVVILLAVFGMVENRSKKTWALSGLALLSLVFALGYFTPIYPLLSECIPVFKSFRGSFKATIFFQLAFSFLAAQGLRNFISRDRPKTWPAWTAFITGMVFFLAAFRIFQGIGFGSISDILQWNASPPPPFESVQFQVQVGAVQIINLAGASILLFTFSLVWLLARSRMVFRYAVVLLGMANLWFFAQSNLSFFKNGELLAEWRAVEKTLEPILGDNRIFWMDNGNRSLFLRKPEIWGDDPSRPKRYSSFMTYLNGSSYYDTPYITPSKAKLTRLSFIIDNKEDYFKKAGLSFSPVAGSGVPLFLAQLPFPTLPRAFLVGDWEKVPDARQAMDRLDMPDFDPVRKVLLESVPDPIPEENPNPALVTVRDLTTDLMEIQTQTDRPQILLITDNYSTGWKAEACPDSAQKKYEVMPGNYINRAIPLTAGKHHFFLKYEPIHFVIGKWISVFSCLAFLLAWFWFRKKYGGIQKHQDSTPASLPTPP